MILGTTKLGTFIVIILGTTTGETMGGCVECHHARERLYRTGPQYVQSSWPRRLSLPKYLHTKSEYGLRFLILHYTSYRLTKWCDSRKQYQAIVVTHKTKTLLKPNVLNICDFIDFYICLSMICYKRER